MSMAVKIGKRVHLRYPVPNDHDEYLALKRASKAFHQPWEPLPRPGSDPYGSAAFDKMLASASSERKRCFLVVKNTEPKIVGVVNLSEISRGCFQNCFMGYWVGQPYRGHGFMTEALRLAVDYLFDDLDLHRVEANIIPSNAASIALIKRLGFRLEGLSQRYLKINGEWQDHERWALTREEVTADTTR